MLGFVRKLQIYFVATKCKQNNFLCEKYIKIELQPPY